MKLYWRSWSALKNNLAYLAIPMLADLFTITAIVFLSSFYRNATIERYSSLFMSVLQAKAAGNELMFIIMSTFMLYAVIYVIFTLLQSVSWHWSYKFCNKQLKFMKILKHYALYNLLWMFLIFAVTIVHKMMLISNTFTGGTGEQIIITIAGLLNFIILYFALISYMMHPLGIGVQKGNIIIPVLFLIWVTYLILDYFAYLSGAISQTLGIIVSIIILLPLITWARVYLILAVKEVIK